MQLAATLPRLVPQRVFPGVGDATLKTANENIGHYYFDRQMWVKASDYFKKIQKWDMVARCFVRLEQWQELRLLVDTKIADTSRELLCDIGACRCCRSPFSFSLNPLRHCLQERWPC